MENKKIEQKEVKKKNHWTKTKVDNACATINKEVFMKQRQSTLLLKFDDMSICINRIITRRGISKGLVKIQEDMNITILEIEKLIIKMYIVNVDLSAQIISLIKNSLWIDIRFLMINKAITPGETINLLTYQNRIDKELEKWSKAISA